MPKASGESKAEAPAGHPLQLQLRMATTPGVPFDSAPRPESAASARS